MTTVWKSSGFVSVWVLARPCDLFAEKYDEVEKKKIKIGCMDDLLSGKCIKSWIVSLPA